MPFVLVVADAVTAEASAFHDGFAGADRAGVHAGDDAGRKADLLVS
jgi:hypothetical protein